MMIYQNKRLLIVNCHSCFVVHQVVKLSQETYSIFIAVFWNVLPKFRMN